MKEVYFVSCVVIAIVGLVGCNGAEKGPRMNDEPYSGPPVIVRVLHQPATAAEYVAVAEVNVPSAGWSLSFDRSEIANDTATMYLTLYSPTQAPVQSPGGKTTPQRHERRCASNDKPFSSAIAYVRMGTAGSVPKDAPYRLAARGSVQAPAPPSSPSSPPPPTAPAAPKAESPSAKPQVKAGDGQQTQARKYEGPPVKVSMLQLQTFPAQNVVGIEVTAPTGGWTLALDRSEVIGDVAKVYLTLERPGADEIVTQALVKHNDSFKTTEVITKSEIYIHLAQRGVSTLTTDYRLAAVGK